MSEQEAQIKIPEEGAVSFEKETRTRFEKIDQLLFAIIASVVISGIAVVVAVIGLFLDQMRYNNAAYRDYAERTRVTNQQQETYNELLRQNKDQNQIILELQEEVKLLKK